MNIGGFILIVRKFNTMLIEKIRSGIVTSMKNKDEVRKDILRTVLGEVQTLEASKNQAGKPVADEQVQSICRKIIEANLETIAVETSEDRKTKLLRENEVLSELAPALLREDEIFAKLKTIETELKAAASEGQAMKLAIGYFKTSNEPVDGKLVKNVVQLVRAS